MAKTILPAQSVPLWRNSDYMLLWSGQLVSSVGTQVSQLAFPLFVLALTHSPVILAIATTLSPHIRHAPAVAEVKNVEI